VSPRAREDSVRPRLQSGASARPLNFTVRRRVPDWIRNSASSVGVFVLTVIAWIYGVPYWRHTLFSSTFESHWSLDPLFLFMWWGFDLFLTLLAGFALLYLVRGKRPVLWAVIVGLGFLVLKIRFTRFWISPDADWGAYVQDYGSWVIPLVGTIVGGLLGERIRSTQHLRRDA
jgi:hypothetical protein